MSQKREFLPIGQNIKKYRYQLGITQQELAEMAGISFSTLAKIESGQNNNPNIITLASIAYELDVSVDTLLGLYG